MRVVRIDPTRAAPDLRIAPGDLLMGVELEKRGVAGRNFMLQQFATVGEVQAFFNAASTYEGAEFRAWIYHDGEVVVVPLRAERLML